MKYTKKSGEVVEYNYGSERGLTPWPDDFVPYPAKNREAIERSITIFVKSTDFKRLTKKKKQR